METFIFKLDFILKGIQYIFMQRTVKMMWTKLLRQNRNNIAANHRSTIFEMRIVGIFKNGHGHREIGHIANQWYVVSVRDMTNGRIIEQMVG